MNAEEQIFAYKELRNNGQAFFIDNYEDADRIIEALEKQIPKKWEYEEINDCDIYACPCCNEYWYLEGMNPTQSEYNYCPNCGQALKWE